MAAKQPYSNGAQVEHSKFGLGTVLSCTDDRIVIKFDDHGEKKFVTQMALSALKKSDREPPVEKRATRRRTVKTAGTATAAAKSKTKAVPEEATATA
jgi:transcription elongation factor GreA-like protein